MAQDHEIAAALADVLRDLRVFDAVARGFAPFADEPLPAAAMRTPPPDVTFALGAQWGHLTLRECLASGSFGTVYRAHDPSLGADVALKLPRIGRPNRQRNARLLDEARRLARVRHPGVVRMHGTAVNGGRAGFWMELVQGQSLSDYLAERGPLPSSEVARVGRALATALEAVHASGMVHGDVKPQNVLREPGGRIVLIDFGSSRDRMDGGATRRVTGTPLYLAPEQLRGTAASVESDIYALGVLLFHLATGDYPVPAATVAELADAFAGGRARRLQDLRPGLPAALYTAIERALRPQPQERFHRAADFGLALATA